MMASNSVYTDSDDKGGMFSTPEMLAILEEMTTEKTEESERNPDEGEENDNPTVCIALPEPDAENITVLTDKLPNTPILPWNHYDSPWKESDPNDSLGEGETDLETKSDFVKVDLNDPDLDPLELIDESLSKNPEDSNEREILP